MTLPRVNYDPKWLITVVKSVVVIIPRVVVNNEGEHMHLRSLCTICALTVRSLITHYMRFKVRKFAKELKMSA